MTIWKYSLPTRGKVTLALPKNANVLAVQNQRGTLVLWASVDDRQPKVARHFDVRLTGGCYGTFANAHYLGTAQLDDGLYVAHVFEVFE